MAAPTTSTAVRIAARRLLSSTTRPQCSNTSCIQAVSMRLQSTISNTASSSPISSKSPLCASRPRLRPLIRPTPLFTAASPLPPLIQNLRRCATNSNDNKNNNTNHDRNQRSTQHGRDSKSHHGPKRNDPAKFTLYAGASLVSVLFALSQPLSYIHVGHHDGDEKHDDGPSKINTGDEPPPPPSSSTAGDGRDPSLPRFRLADVRKHDANSGSPWVTSGDKVYDITDWVAAHPGGDVILRAAGHSIDPYWAIFTIHKAPHVREILDSYLIGFVDVLDLDNTGKPKIAAGEELEDPFSADPKRDERLVVLTQKPCNAEPAPPQLARDFATPNELFYVRNHMWVPVVEKAEAAKHQLTVELPDGEVRSYTLDELQSKFPRHTVTAVLQCSGNRRSDMTRAVGKTNGLQWGAGAISNAVWEGVLLRDVLADAGLKAARPTPRGAIEAPRPKGGDDEDDEAPPDSLHVQLTGMEAYAASIPLPAALDPRGEVLLAYGMNGQPLPRDHGYPLRAVVPGFVAARSVKWLSKIVVSDEESQSQWQRRDYKLFGPNEGGAPDWDKYPAIQEMPITSAITGLWVGKNAIGKAVKEGHLGSSVTPTPFSQRAVTGVRDLPAWQAQWKDATKSLPGTPVTATGYAYSGGGREIVRVDVSVDGGRTWDQATLLDQKNREYDDETDRSRKNIVARGRRDFAWKRWRYDGVLLGSEPTSEVVVKAIDSAYNTQPERHDGIYNVRGNLATAWHRVTIDRTAGAKKEATLHGCGFDKECKK